MSDIGPDGNFNTDKSQNPKTSGIADTENPVSHKNANNSPGSMAGSVGTGKHAKTNIIWYIVSASFVVFSCIVSSLVVMTIYGYNVSSLSQDIKDIWGIFTPILTLALGYLFGKEGKIKKKSLKTNKK